MKYLIEHVLELTIGAVVFLAIIAFIWFGNIGGHKGLAEVVINNRFQTKNNDITMEDYKSLEVIEYQDNEGPVELEYPIVFDWRTMLTLNKEYALFSTDDEENYLIEPHGQIDKYDILITNVTKIDTEIHNGEELYDVTFSGGNKIMSRYASTVMVTVEVKAKNTNKTLKKYHKILQFGEGDE